MSLSPFSCAPIGAGLDHGNGPIQARDRTSSNSRTEVMAVDGNLAGRYGMGCQRKWRNWQTRRPQEPVGETPWEFKSPLPHQLTSPGQCGAVLRRAGGECLTLATFYVEHGVTY